MNKLTQVVKYFWGRLGEKIFGSPQVFFLSMSDIFYGDIPDHRITSPPYSIHLVTKNSYVILVIYKSKVLNQIQLINCKLQKGVSIL